MVAVKCDLCYFREEGPACIQVCPTKALSLVEPKDISALNEEKRQKSIDSAAVFALKTALGN